METRAVEIGKKFDIPIFVGKTLSETGGTYIMNRSTALEEKLVTGISIAKDILITTILNIPYSSEKIAEIFTAVDNYGLNINMITQNILRDGTTEISFSCQASEKYLLNQVIKRVKEIFPEADIEYREGLGMISVIGVGMINNSGIAGRFFSALSKAGVNFYQVTTSEISISCSIDRGMIEQAVNAAAEEFCLWELSKEALWK